MVGNRVVQNECQENCQNEQYRVHNHQFVFGENQNPPMNHMVDDGNQHESGN